MKRRGRARRAAKWAGVAACALIAVAWALSIVWEFGREDLRPSPRIHTLLITRGCFTAMCTTGHYPLFLGPDVPGDWLFQRRESYWRTDTGRTERPYAMQWWPVMHSGTSPTGSCRITWLPLWIPFVAFALPTAWLSWRDRRAPPGRCACGYDLAGLAENAPCPECGRSPESAARGDSLRRGGTSLSGEAS